LYQQESNNYYSGTTTGSSSFRCIQCPAEEASYRGVLQEVVELCDRSISSMKRADMPLQERKDLFRYCRRLLKELNESPYFHQPVTTQVLPSVVHAPLVRLKYFDVCLSARLHLGEDLPNTPTEELLPGNLDRFRQFLRNKSGLK
jgi:hypothetical protein